MQGLECKVGARLKRKEVGVVQMAQWVKALDTQPDDPAEGKKRLLQIVL